MNFINEYALLFAVALPVVVIVGIQVALFIAGERGTGLLPGLNRYPSIALNKAVRLVSDVLVRFTGKGHAGLAVKAAFIPHLQDDQRYGALAPTLRCGA